MTYQVRELPRARIDVSRIFGWLDDRSPTGAEAWLVAYDRTLADLADAPYQCPEAEEADSLLLPARQAVFRTRHGRNYRVVFHIADDDQTVYVLRVRGPGQPPLTAEEIPVPR